LPIEFDIRLSTPGPHRVRSAVRAEARRTVLPPDLFAKLNMAGAARRFGPDRTDPG
jgi:hypothetical protein